MTVVTMFSIFLKRKIGLHERQLLVQSAGTFNLGGVVGLIKRIILISLCIEAIGAVFLSFQFCPQMGLLKGIWNSIFHSISAFCNAGFDLMGKFGAFSSLTGYVDNVLVNGTIIMLIILGGIGFVVLDDIINHKLKFKKYSLNSKIVLSVSGILIIIGWILFYIFEANNLLADLSIKGKITAALFQSVTPRTAGFNTIDSSLLTEASAFLTIVLMIIGGSSGSTAGGIKTTTLAILVLSSFNSFRKTKNMVAFKRKLDDRAAKRAAAIFTIYLFAVITGTMAICAIEPVSLKEAFYECASALGTVGLTLGITQTLSISGKIVIIVLMFAGRVGLITLLLALAKKRMDPPVERPNEKILIG